MKRLICIVSILTIVMTISISQTIAAQRGRPLIFNNDLVAENGWPLRGENPRMQDSSRNDDNYWIMLRDQFNLNTVRILCYREPQNWVYGDNHGCGWDCNLPTVQASLPYLDDWVNKSEQHGFYCIIDYHPVGGHSEINGEIGEWWTVVAPRYKDKTHVIYEACNEPVAWHPIGYNANEVKFQEDLYLHIRNLAPDTPIILWSFANGAYEMKQKVDESVDGQGMDIDYSNAIVGWHIYGRSEAGVQLLKANYPQMQTEIGGWSTADYDAGVAFCENLGVSWILLDGTDSSKPVTVTWSPDPYFSGIPVTPTITVTSPNGGENWTVNWQETVTWQISGIVNNANIELSTNGGSSWISLVSNTANDGSEVITVPNSPSTACKIRVQETDGDPTDTSDNNFTISVDDIPPTITSVRAINLTTVSVEYSEPVEQVSAETISNYSIDNSITISNAVLNSSDLKTVTLTTSQHTEGITYTITIDNIKDRAPTPNTIVVNSQKSYIYNGRSYNGVPSIPGTVECEDYDIGGEVISYHDTTSNNEGNAYRTGADEGVDVETCGEGGYNVGWTHAGEWIEYTVNVENTGTYTVNIRVATPYDGAQVHLEFGGVDKTGLIDIPNTGGWYDWQTVSLEGVSLDAGNQVMRLVVDTEASGWSGNYNYIEFTEGGPVTPKITVISPNGGEIWEVNTQQTIRWICQGYTGTVSIYLSTEGGINYASLLMNTENDGSEVIAIPNSPSTTCRIMVQESNGSLSDTSDSNFTIEASPDPESISIDETTLDFGEIELGKTSTLDFTITNTGGGLLSGSISTDKKWIEVEPTSFEGNLIIVNVTVDNDILNQPEGQYTETINITSNGGNIDVEVTLVATCVLVKPNPYDPSKGNLTFFGNGIVPGVPGGTTIRIYTLGGELVAESFSSPNGNLKVSSTYDNEMIWDGKNKNGEEVSSGIYIYVYESPKEKGIGKFTVINK